LKPLVYALGIDAGKITPKTVLADVPGNFAGYAPENFDRSSTGRSPWRSRWCIRSTSRR
jgi:penicillin-binding protein 1C